MRVISGICLGSFGVADIERAMKASPGAPGGSADKALCQLRASEGYLLPVVTQGKLPGAMGWSLPGKVLVLRVLPKLQVQLLLSCTHVTPAPAELQPPGGQHPSLGPMEGPNALGQGCIHCKDFIVTQYKTQKRNHKIQILPYWWLQVIIKFQMEFKVFFFLILLLFIFMSYVPFNSEDLFFICSFTSLPFHTHFFVSMVS